MGAMRKTSLGYGLTEEEYKGARMLTPNLMVHKDADGVYHFRYATRYAVHLNYRATYDIYGSTEDGVPIEMENPVITLDIGEDTGLNNLAFKLMKYNPSDSILRLYITTEVLNRVRFCYSRSIYRATTALIDAVNRLTPINIFDSVGRHFITAPKIKQPITTRVPTDFWVEKNEIKKAEEKLNNKREIWLKE